jgi:hypothetical protein
MLEDFFALAAMVFSSAVIGALGAKATQLLARAVKGLEGSGTGTSD